MLNKDFVRFGGGAGDTQFTPVALALLVLAGLLILILPRKYALAPFLLGSLFIPISQTLVVAGVHLTAYRLLVTVAWLRLLVTGPSVRTLRLNVIDKVFMLWGASAALTFCLLWLDLGAVVNRVALVYDAFGIYFLIRLSHRTILDLERTTKILAVGCAVIAVGMLAEHFSGVNPFSILGASSGLDVLGDRIRSRGPFAHPIIAGSCAAGLFPLFAGLWWQGRARYFAALGAISVAVMTVTSTSSTAAVSFGAGLAALLLWPLRKHLKLFRQAAVIILIILHFSMKAPVWALIARVDLMGGSSSYHRFELVNQTILHFWDWCLLGQKTTYQWGFNLWDTANTYVETAVTGGLSTLVLFFAIIAFCFQRLGIARKATPNSAHAKSLWALGAALFANAIGFIGITYYDQAAVCWYSLIALISGAVTLAIPAVVTRQKRLEEESEVHPLVLATVDSCSHL
jgi:hypothetical protein